MFPRPVPLADLANAKVTLPMTVTLLQCDKLFLTGRTAAASTILPSNDRDLEEPGLACRDSLLSCSAALL